MPVFERDGLSFNYIDIGSGTPFVFQHGLGGDVSQPSGLFSPPAGFRLLSFDCRAHGETVPLGDPSKIGLAAFADDLMALLDHKGLAAAVVGGISMGAAVALNACLRYPDRVAGLVLSRPAWLERPITETSMLYPKMASLIREHGAQGGLRVFRESEDYATVARLSPDAAASLVKAFEHPRAEETVIKMDRIPRDTPCNDRRRWASIGVPTLVLANRHDVIHPFEYGETLAREIPGAEFKELTSKSISPERHAAQVQAFIEGFLKQHFTGLSKN